MTFLHIHDMQDVYRLVGSAVVGWFLNSIWNWWKHCFWFAFKATFIASMKKGSKLTPEETAAIQKQVEAKLQSEWQGKMKKWVGAMDDPLEAPQIDQQALDAYEKLRMERIKNGWVPPSD
jgi:hypothetical protein